MENDFDKRLAALRAQADEINKFENSQRERRDNSPDPTAPCPSAPNETVGPIASEPLPRQQAAIVPDKAAGNTRFKKGRSGNPKGRPRKEARATSARQQRQDFFEVLDETIPIGGTGKVTTLGKAVFRQIIVSAIKGDIRASKLTLDLWTGFLNAAYNKDRDKFNMIDTIQDYVNLHGSEASPELIQQLNYMKSKTKFL